MARTTRSKTTRRSTSAKQTAEETPQTVDAAPDGGKIDDAPATDETTTQPDVSADPLIPADESLSTDPAPEPRETPEGVIDAPEGAEDPEAVHTTDPKFTPVEPIGTASEGDGFTVEPTEAASATDTAPAVDAATVTDDTPLDTDAPEVAAGVGDDTLGSGTDAHTPVETVEPRPVVERRGGFGAMLLGGFVAGIIGFLAGQMTDMRLPFVAEPPPDTFPDETRTALGDQSSRLDSLAARLDEADQRIAGIDLAPLSDTVEVAAEELAALQDTTAALEERLSAVDTRLGEVDDRLTTLEKAPVAESVSPEAIAAYERELDALRADITQQREEIEQQRSETEAMVQEAMAAKDDAEAQAAMARTRSAMAEVSAAVEAGEPYAEPLQIVAAGVDEVPGPLADNAEEGVPTQETLIDGFPDAARAALTNARTNDDTEPTLGDYFRGALNARSVQPRTGDDPDAVLSRAEAQLRLGHLDTTLEELQALPDAGREAMSDWIALAERRQAALQASDELSRQLNEE